jgi:hypothetical protein
MRYSITQGVNFILNHFKDDNSLWPKFIASGDNFHVKVGCEEQMVSEFYKSKLMDCRICPFPDFVEDYRKSDVRECMAIEGAGIVPNFLFFDLDKGRFARTLDAFQEDAITNALNRILQRINTLFHGDFKPSILQTGNGYHIYLPVQLYGPSWCLGHTDIFLALTKTPDRDFLQWAEWYISDSLCDWQHCKVVSFNNMYCRVPGSFNSKNGKPVTIIQEWDGQRPYINWILKAFYDHLIDESKEPKKPSNDDYKFGGFSTKWNN